MVLDKLGRPQDYFRVIHVAGSNGKGSVCAYIESALRENGYKTGLYTSPHIFDIRERIMVDGKKAPDDLWEKFGNELWEEVRLCGVFLTYFEFLTVLMFLIFREMKVEVAVIEAGLGGRYDATNVGYKNKLLSIITSISLEHTALLGNTRLKILKEKEQILGKTGLGLFNIKEKNLVSHIWKTFGGRAFFTKDFYLVKESSPGMHKLKAHTGKIIKVKTKMPEPVQAENLATALAALEIINAFGVFTNISKSLRGISKTRLYGRFTMIGKGLYLSVAHNADAMKKVTETLFAVFGGRPVVIVFTALKDKNIKAMISEIKKYKKVFLVITQLNNERAEKAETIEKIAKNAGVMCRVEKDPKKALKFAVSFGAEAVVVCGSFYLAAAVD